MLRDTTPNEPWMEADPISIPMRSGKRGYMERPEDTGKPCVCSKDGTAFAASSRSRAVRGPPCRGRAAGRSVRTKIGSTMNCRARRRDESDRRQGKSVEDQLEEENEANRQRQTQVEGYRTGGRVKKARAECLIPMPNRLDRTWDARSRLRR